jgi:hypothetical protein
VVVEKHNKKTRRSLYKTVLLKCCDLWSGEMAFIWGDRRRIIGLRWLLYGEKGGG